MATFAQFYAFTALLPDGTLLTDGSLYHYAAGTSTDKDIYDSRAKSSTLAQPLTCDANGVFSFYGDGLYKLVVKDGDGDTLYTWDNVAIVDADPQGEGAAIASASTLVLGTDGNIFHVTGTTTIAAISGAIPLVTLIFDDVLTLTHSASLVLNGGVDFLTASGTVKQFVNDGGGVWREIALSLDTVVVDIKVKKDTPRIRILGTEGSAEEYNIAESAGDCLIQRNDGTEASPSWTTVAQYDNSLGKWIFTGNLDVTGEILLPEITDMTDATHDHTDAAGGGILTGNAASGNDAALSGSVNDTPLTSTATATITTKTGAKVHVTASAYADLSGSVSGIVYMRVYRDSVSNVVAQTPINASGSTNADMMVPVVGLDAPTAGSHTYTVDFVRDTAGTASTLAASEINLVAFTVV